MITIVTGEINMYFNDIYKERNEKYQTAYESQIQAIKKIRDDVLFKHFPKEEVNNFLE